MPMELRFQPKLPLRFSSIFWTKHEITTTETDTFQYFDTDVFINQDGLHAISLNIAASREESEIKSYHAYRIDGRVGTWGSDHRPILMEDTSNTIVIDHAKVRPNCMINKVCAQGLGQIVEQSIRRTSGIPIKAIKVLHQGWNSTHSQSVDFHVNYLLDPHYTTSSLKENALAAGNLISLRGNVVSIGMDNTWEIQVRYSLGYRNTTDPLQSHFTEEKQKTTRTGSD
ncbi:uncharacterized protein MELLADRAFT_66375 [Melampsora larici-populina 98AG31]|uniref:Uncharacterized protein n=1 Tax=Melampsora larici-populina (strain 98AG31 / pathotype 3-4-7) TaxID=747676 RepID=F4RYY5_MELLP|nr:uncharacterized protein MELLADRAFT_66375 [Melampsora larici-populina 98AG31]EGG02421.1 hypothetical protein MELLADRAFT_66375 [Melampsora larici-populina 98AG31]